MLRHLLPLLMLLTLPMTGTGVELSGSGAKQPHKPRITSSTATRPQVVSKDKLREMAIRRGPIKPEIDQSRRTNFPDPKLHPTPNRP